MCTFSYTSYSCQHITHIKLSKRNQQLVDKDRQSHRKSALAQPIYLPMLRSATRLESTVSYLLPVVNYSVRSQTSRLIILVMLHMSSVHFVIVDICRMGVGDHIEFFFGGMAHSLVGAFVFEKPCADMTDLLAPSSYHLLLTLLDFWYRSCFLLLAHNDNTGQVWDSRMQMVFHIPHQWIGRVRQHGQRDARSSLATTDLAFASTRLKHSDEGDMKRKTISYTPWNERFLIRYNGHLIVFRREYRAREFSSREEISLSCLSRLPQILKELLAGCRIEYSKLIHGKISLYEDQDGTWARSMVSDVRHISTLVLDECVKKELLKDIEDFLNQTARRWYSNRGIPHRRGYLLYGPSGTGKSSLSLSIAGYFGLDIYILSLSAINEDHLKDLFAKLPSRCVILVELFTPLVPSDPETLKQRTLVRSSLVPLSNTANLSLERCPYLFSWTSLMMV